MKKIISACIVLIVALNVFGQSDTLDYPFTNLNNGTQQPLLIGAQGGGFVCGSNTVTTEVGQIFETTSADLVEVAFWAGQLDTIGAPDYFRINVYNVGASGLPSGSPLGFLDVRADSIFASSSPQDGINVFDFPVPIPVTGKFAVTIDVNLATRDDTLGLVSNGTGDGFGQQLSIGKLSSDFGGNWAKMADIWVDWDSDILMQVVVDNVELGANATIISGGNQVCPGDLVRVSANIGGGSNNLDIRWTPNNPPNNIVNPFSEETDIEVATTTTFTVTVIDLNSSDTVSSNVTITVNGITVDVNDTSLVCGGCINLHATAGGIPSGASFLWSNGTLGLNNNVCQPGDYTVTASNSFGCSAVATSTVALTGTTQEVDFSVTTEAGTIACTNEVIQFNNESSHTNNWDWTWEFNDSDSTISFAENPTFAYSSAGTYTVVLTADSSACGLVKMKQVTVTVCPGIEEASILNQYVDIYPNPTSGTFNINFRELDGEKGLLEIFDIKGKKVFTQDLSITGDLNKTIDLSDQAEGIYVVKIEMKDEVLIEKLNLSR